MRKLLSFIISMVIVIGLMPAMNVQALDPAISIVQAGAPSGGIYTFYIQMQGMHCTVGTFAFTYDNTVFDLYTKDGVTLATYTAASEATTVRPYLHSGQIDQGSANILITGTTLPAPKASVSLLPTYMGVRGSRSEVYLSWFNSSGFDTTAQNMNLFGFKLKLKAGKTAANINNGTITIGNYDSQVAYWIGATTAGYIKCKRPSGDTNLYEYFYPSSAHPAGTISFVKTYDNMANPGYSGELSTLFEQTIDDTYYGAVDSGQTEELVFTNTSDAALTGINVSFTGSNFELAEPLAVTTLAVDESLSFAVKLKSGLNASLTAYSTAVTVNSAQRTGLESVKVKQLVGKAAQETVAAPSLETMSVQTVTLNTATGGSGTGSYQYGYALVDNPVSVSNWTSSRTFTLVPVNVPVYFFAKRLESANYLVSEPSFSLMLELPKLQQAAVSLSAIGATSTATSITVPSATGGNGTGVYKYLLKSDNSAPGSSDGGWVGTTTFIDLSPNTTYYVFAYRVGDGTYNDSSASVAAVITTQKQNQTEAVVFGVPTTDSFSISFTGATGGSGTGVYKYMIKTENVTPLITDSGWTTETTFTGLEQQTTYYLFAYREGDVTYNSSSVSAAKEVTTLEYKYRPKGQIQVNNPEGKKPITMRFVRLDESGLETAEEYQTTALFATGFDFALELPPVDAYYNIYITAPGYRRNVIQNHPFTGSVSDLSFEIYPGDLRDVDNKINVLDISTLIKFFGQTSASENSFCDLNDDGSINATDISVIIANFGR